VSPLEIVFEQPDVQDTCPLPTVPSDVPNTTTDGCVRPQGPATASTVAGRLMNHIHSLGTIRSSSDANAKSIENAKKALREAELFLEKHPNDPRVGPLHTELQASLQQHEGF